MCLKWLFLLWKYFHNVYVEDRNNNYNNYDACTAPGGPAPAVVTNPVPGPAAVPAPAHVPGVRHGAALAATPALRPVAHSRAHGGGCGGARGGGGNRRHGVNADPDPGNVSYKSYPDVGNNLPAFTPSHQVGTHFGQCPLHNNMTKAVDFVNLFITVDMINTICRNTNSYANEHIFEGTHQTYPKSDGSWEDVTPDEIKKFIALLIYFVLWRLSVMLKNRVKGPYIMVSGQEQSCQEIVSKH